MSPEQLDDLVEQVRLLAQDVAATQAGMDVAFGAERVAEQELLLVVLDAVRPAFPWLSEHSGPVEGLRDGRAELRQVTIDSHGQLDQMVEWVVCDHDELGLVIARRPVARVAQLVWPGKSLPSGRDGGPRLARALESLVDRLVRHATGHGPRRRREASVMAERLRAIQTLLEL